MARAEEVPALRPMTVHFIFPMPVSGIPFLMPHALPSRHLHAPSLRLLLVRLLVLLRIRHPVHRLALLGALAQLVPPDLRAVPARLAPPVQLVLPDLPAELAPPDQLVELVQPDPLALPVPPDPLAPLVQPAPPGLLALTVPPDLLGLPVELVPLAPLELLDRPDLPALPARLAHKA